MENVLVPIVLFATLFLGLPWLIFHYVTQWKKAGTITQEDENLLDELYDTARRLDERMISIERIIAADNPDWRRPESLDEDRSLPIDAPGNVRRL